MTTPNVEELITYLQGLANEIEIPYPMEVIEEAAEVLQSQAERIAELERESETHSKAYGLAIVERDNLRAQLAAIAATEPHYWEYKGSLYQSKVNDACEALFTRPMPAQDVTELVEALQLFADALPLERSTIKTCYAVTDQMRDAAHAALSKYKGAK